MIRVEHITALRKHLAYAIAPYKSHVVLCAIFVAAATLFPTAASSEKNPTVPLRACRALMGVMGQVAITATITAIFGPAAGALHVSTAAIAIVLLATFDYIIHYGLSRPLFPGSSTRYKPVTPLSSWNSFYKLEVRRSRARQICCQVFK